MECLKDEYKKVIARIQEMRRIEIDSEKEHKHTTVQLSNLINNIQANSKVDTYILKYIYIY